MFKTREIPILETERLRLRPFQPSDFEDAAAMFGDPEVMRYLGRGTPYSRELTWGNLAYMAGHWQFLGYGMWAVEEKATGQLAGRIGCCQPYGWPGFELAWALVRSRWGRGYATEGAQAAMDWAFEILEQDRVISLIHPENHASIRVAERLGEHLQGRTPILGVEHLVYGAERPEVGVRQLCTHPSGRSFAA